jgi:hypothetical protein
MPRDANISIFGAAVDADGNLHVTEESTAATYGVAGIAMTPAAIPTDIVTLVGSATKTLRIKRVVISGLATTAGTMDVSLVKRTVANTGGTATQPSISQFDSSDVAPTGVVNQFSVNPTGLGTGVIVSSQKLNFPLATAGAASNLVFDFATRNDKPIILRGIAQCLAINLNAQALSGGNTVSYAIEWSEDLS